MKSLAAVVALALAAACNSSGSAKPEPTAPPISPSIKPVDPDPREQVLATMIAQVLEQDHLRRLELDDAVSVKAFAGYLASLDPGKVFLLAEHVSHLRQYERLMDDELREGRLTLAHVGAAYFAQRLEVVRKIVEAQLAKPFDLTVDETLETDDDKLEFCTTEAELADRWRKTLKLDVLARLHRMDEMASALADGASETEKKMAAKIPKTPAEREVQAREELAKSYAGRFARLADVEPLDNAAMFINAVAQVFDPHTAYLPPVSRDNFDIAMSGSLEGIGAVLREDDHFIRVVEIVPGGASWRQGVLETGDLILAVAQEGEEPVDVIDMRINKVVSMIRGPKGSVVTLTIKKPDDSVKLLSITRDVVKIEAAYARGAVLEHSTAGKVGYIYLPSFYGNTRDVPGQTPERSCTEDVRALLGQMNQRKLPRIILDLRGNGGGLLDDATLMSGLFIETGPIVQTRAPDGEQKVLVDKDTGVEFRGDVVVMIDQFSASASEILAAALQDYRRAVIVGPSASHGKGTVQVILDLDRFARSAGKGQSLGVLKLTRQQFFRPSGSSTQWRGVVPDILLPNPSAYIESGERHRENSLPWSEVEPLEFERWPNVHWNVEKLVAASKLRQAAEPAFTTIEKRNQLMSARRKDTLAPLERAAWQARLDQQKKQLEALDPKLDDAPERFKVTPVTYRKPDPAAVDDDKKWTKSLARDPWLEEALHVLQDMAAAH